MFKKIQKDLNLVKEGETNVIQALYEQPRKDKYKAIPSYKRGGAEPGQTYSADLLEMPEDKGFKYLLVVVDTITGLTDAAPLKTKDSENVLKGFKDIFTKGTPLSLPKWSIQVDPGSEFKSVVKKYFDDNGILVRVGKVDRSRHQAMAENRNKIIAKALFQKQVGQEILTNKVSVEWVDDIQTVIDAINDYEREKYKTEKKKEIAREKKNGIPLPYLQKGIAILEVGTKVRIKLDKPKGVLGEKLHGTFRATDIKWEPTIRTITNIILTPNQPVMYQVDKATTGYTRNQLQIVDAKEKQPPQELLSKQKESLQQATTQIENAIPQAMAKAVQQVQVNREEVPKKKPKNTITSYKPIPITSIAPKSGGETRSGRQVIAKKVFDL